jgi:hypothetical protein
METLDLRPTTEGYRNMALMLRQQIEAGNTDSAILDGFVEVVAYLKAIEEIGSTSDL